jgi:hypothetical protein
MCSSNYCWYCSLNTSTELPIWLLTSLVWFQVLELVMQMPKCWFESRKMNKKYFVLYVSMSYSNLSELIPQNLLLNLLCFVVEYKTRTGRFKRRLKFIVKETSQNKMIVLRMKKREIIHLCYVKLHLILLFVFQIESQVVYYL